jgi:hypothetical protein
MVEDTNKQEIEVEWSFTLPGYFEDQVILKRDGYSIEINSGCITAKMTADFFDSRPGFRDSLTQELNDYFLGAQAIRRQAFDIQGGAIVRKWPDGRRDTTIVVQSAAIKMTAGNSDLVYTDPDSVVHDTRKERIDATNHLGKLSARHADTDQTGRKILDSFDASVRDPENELVHLYEIWEALTQKFGSERNAKRALGVSSGARSKLGQLANNEPLNQGRHRGRHAGSLRDATAEELDEARAIARDMLASYLEYLDRL